MYDTVSVCNEKWTWVSYISNVLSNKTIFFDILDFWCQLVVIRFVKTLLKRRMFVSSWKFQRVDYCTAWSNSTKSVEKRDLPKHGQTCGHRFADVIWRIPNPTLTDVNWVSFDFNVSYSSRWCWSQDWICSRKKSLILRTFPRTLSFRIPFYCVLSSGMLSGFMNPPTFSFCKPWKEKPPKRPGAATWAVKVSM